MLITTATEMVGGGVVWCMGSTQQSQNGKGINWNLEFLNEFLQSTSINPDICIYIYTYIYIYIYSASFCKQQIN